MGAGFLEQNKLSRAALLQISIYQTRMMMDNLILNFLDAGVRPLIQTPAIRRTQIFKATKEVE